MRGVSRPGPKLSALILAPILVCGGALAMAGITVVGERQTVEAEDGFPLLTYRLSEKRSLRPKAPPPRGLLFYVQGSSCSSVTYVAEVLAGATAAGLPVILTEKRGVGEDGEADTDLCHEHSAKSRRVEDQAAVLAHYLEGAPADLPVILLGTSEGGDVAAAVAAREPRVRLLVLLATGGGWSQEEEFRHFLREDPPYLGLENEAELDAVLEEIRAAPDSLELWAGLPLRRWSSYLWDPPLDDLLGLDIPIFLGHGREDESVPVASARAVEEAFRKAGKANLTYREYAGADHAFQQAASGSNLLPRIELDLIRWFADQGVLPPEDVKKLERRVRRKHKDLF